MIQIVLNKCLKVFSPDKITIVNAFLGLGGVTLLVISVCAPILYWAETSHPDANIQTWQDAIWLCFMIVTTIGFGDFYPVSTLGRFTAVPLAATGIGVFGTLAGYFGSIILDKIIRQATTDMLHEQNARIEELTKQNYELNAHIKAVAIENKELNRMIVDLSKSNETLNQKIDADTDDILKALNDFKK